MTEHDPAGEDPHHLRDALARLDPAAALTPADPTRTARLVEDAMTAPETDPTQTRTPLLAAIAAVVVLLAAVAGFSALRDDSGSDTTAGDTPSATSSPSDAGSGTPAPASLTLSLPDAAQGRCAVPSAEVLAGAAVAIEATVESIEGGVASVSVSKVYAGDPALSTVTVKAPTSDAQALIAAVDLQEGGSYLLAGTDAGELMVCGFSGPTTPSLRALYEQAFAR